MKNRETLTTVTGRFIGGGLFQPRTQEEGKPPRHNACVVLDEGQEDKIKLALTYARNEKWGSKKPAGLTIWGVRKGEDEEFENSYGMSYINPKSSRLPELLVKRNGKFVQVTEDDDLLYPGCYVAVSVEAYGYDGDKAKSIKPGVSLNLRGVMFRRHGERLSDYVDAENEFEGLDSEVEEDIDAFLAA